MKRIKYLLLFSLILMGSTSSDFVDKEGFSTTKLSPRAMELLQGKQILFIEREQFARDHHNTATLFQKGEINEEKFAPGSALRIYNVSEGTIKTLVESKTGVVRDPELSFDARKVIFSMRKNKDDAYSLYEGDVKYLRVIETPEKRTWIHRGWGGQGEQAPAVNWHSFETKRILGDVAVEADGSAHIEVPAKTFVYFQLLDKDKKMVHSMRSGTMVMPGEINGCIGCHEDRLSVPPPGPSPYALRRGPQKLKPLIGNAPVNFSFMEHVQPVFDKHCITCHDFDKDNRNKLVLARDKNPFFNASYINLYTGKYVTLVGGGPAEIQFPYSWGSHASKLTKVIDGGHHDVKLSQHEREILYAWMDVNGVYYPVYESAFDSTLAGRSPLNDNEINELGELTGINFGSLNRHTRPLSAQISFDRPEESPCLDKIREDKNSFNRAVAILKIGQERLAATPRGDIESELVPCYRHREQLKKYMEQLEIEQLNNVAIQQNKKFYDVR